MFELKYCEKDSKKPFTLQSISSLEGVCMFFGYCSFRHWHCSTMHTFHWRFNLNAKHICSLNFCNLFAKFYCFSNNVKFINHTTGLNKWNAFYIHFGISMCIFSHLLLQKKSEQGCKLTQDFRNRLP